jgi:hypothetical protein
MDIREAPPMTMASGSTILQTLAEFSVDADYDFNQHFDASPSAMWSAGHDG